MTKVQKYFSGLKIQTYDVSYKKDYVIVIYFTRNDELFNDEFDPSELINVYCTVDKLCNELIYEDSDVGTSELFYYTDCWFDCLEELIPEEQRDEINPADYAIVQHCSECNYECVMNVFNTSTKMISLRLNNKFVYIHIFCRVSLIIPCAV